MSAICERRRGSKVPGGEAIFTTSQVWTVPKGVKKVDVFLVGGGSSGEGGSFSYVDESRQTTAGRGGNGGQTKTILNHSVAPLSQISVIIGAGGVSNKNSYEQLNTGMGWRLKNAGSYSIVAGGNTYFGDLIASGGNSSIGGSGGGGQCIGRTSNIQYGYELGASYAQGNGGVDGSNGLLIVSPPTYGYNGIIGVGQNTTTRAFGETAGTLFSGGGGGGSKTFDIFQETNNAGWYIQKQVCPKGYGSNGGGNGAHLGYIADEENAFTLSWYVYNHTLSTNGTPNTGSGGGGGYSCTWSGVGSDACFGADGGSGIAIVRWAAQ